MKGPAMRTWVMLVMGMIGVLLLGGCGGKGIARLSPGPRMAAGGIRTVTAYWKAAGQTGEKMGLKGEAKDAWVAVGVGTLVQCESEAGRAYARAVLAVLREEGVVAGEMPSVGTREMSYEELARIDAATIGLVHGSKGRVRLRLLEVVARECPADYGVFLAAVVLAGELGKDEPELEQLKREVGPGTWKALHARFADVSRPVTLSTGAGLKGSGYLWGYVSYYAGVRACETSPQRVCRELLEIAEGLERMSRAVVALDKELEQDRLVEACASEAKGLRTLAGMLDRHVAIARAARPNMERALEGMFGLSGLEVLAVSVTEKPGRLAIRVRGKNRAGGEHVETHAVSVRKEGRTWVVAAE